MKKLLISLSIILITQCFGFVGCGCFNAYATNQINRINISETPLSDASAIDLSKASILYDPSDALVVGKTAELLSQDILEATGQSLKVNPSKKDLKGKGKELVIIGTIGQSKYIDDLIKSGKLDVSPIQGGWERYIIKTIDNPMKGIDKAVVIAGSDRRGTAYGVFSLSEAIGVNPWYWFADVPVKKNNGRYLSADYISKEPSVKYRGIFINDEDWGLKPWSSLNYEPELGDIGPRTYARICELLLRLRANMLGPAMHSCTGAFYSHPESKMVADTFGIIITTSHCEPLLLNNASKDDWDSDIDGQWDYGRNPEGIRSRWNRRLDEAACYENIYTTAMRGLHDEGMRGNYTMEEKVSLLERVIIDQRQMLSEHTGREATEIPQIFVPYKETMGVYENGLNVPDDITLVWVDDNYGYMKRVSSPDEQKRKGGSGVYYHTSYLGAPHDYLWINTTPPALMYTELMKAYQTGADRYWLLNVGDIKPCELGMTTFFDLAWDVDAFSYDNINRHQAPYLAQIFDLNAEQSKEMQWLLDEYYRLAWSRKPEYMGWEREWDFKELEHLKDTEYSFDNYNDAQQRLADYKAVSDKAQELMSALPEQYQPAFFEIIAHPAMGSYQMNRKFLMAQLNHELAAKGDYAQANWAASQSKAAHDSIDALNARYNSQLDGKWNHMMAIAPGLCAKYQNMPELTLTEGVAVIPSSKAQVNPEESILEGCTVIDLKNYKAKSEEVNLIEGLGYDWLSVQLGEPAKTYETPVEAKYTFNIDNVSALNDSVEVTIYTLPIWPIYKGKSTQFSVSVDGSSPQVFENAPKEYSPLWKTQVLQNATVHTAKFPINPNSTDSTEHQIHFKAIDPGIILQRVVVDWGGLKKTYVGPSLSAASNR